MANRKPALFRTDVHAFYEVEAARERNSAVSLAGVDLLGRVFPAFKQDFFVGAAGNIRKIFLLAELRTKPPKGLSNDVLNVVLEKITNVLRSNDRVKHEPAQNHLVAIRRTLVLEFARRNRNSLGVIKPEMLDLIVVELRHELDRMAVHGSARQQLEGLFREYASEWARRNPEEISK